MAHIKHKDVKEAVIDPETGLVATPPGTFWRVYKKKLILSEEEAFRIALVKRTVTNGWFSAKRVHEETLVDIPMYARGDLSYHMLKYVVADTGLYDFRILSYDDVDTLDEDALLFNSIVAMKEYNDKVARAAASNDRFIGDYPPKTVKGQDNGEVAETP